MAKPNYLLIAVPTEEEKKANRQKIYQKLGKNMQLFEFHIPNLKVGTLDQLMKLSDNLAKLDPQAEAITKRFDRSFQDLLANKPAGSEEKKDGGKDKNRQQRQQKKKHELKITTKRGANAGVKKVKPQEYVEKFTWNRLFKKSDRIESLSTKMMKEVLRADDDLKQKTSQFNDVRLTLEGIDRQDTGTLLVRPLGAFIEKKDITETDHITTVIVVVPKRLEEFWKNNYELLERDEKKYKQDREEAGVKQAEKRKKDQGGGEKEIASKPAEEKKEESPEEKAAREEQEAEVRKEKEKAERQEREQAKLQKLNSMCDNVIPRSSRKLTESGDFCLYSVLVFRKGLENFKRICRTNKFTVRPFKYDPNGVKARKARKDKLIEKRRNAYNHTIQWISVWYDRVFVRWIHLKALRTFVESALRFGLPINFQAFLILPKKGKESTVRKGLSEIFNTLGNPSLMDDKGGKSEDTLEFASMGVGEYYPYVSLTLDLTTDF